MSIRGSLGTMCIEDIFDWIDKRKLVGRLSLDRGGQTHTFEFLKGVVIGASSSHPGDQLGQLLMSRNTVSEKQLRDAFQIQAKTGAHLGTILLAEKVLEEKILSQVLQTKFREAVWEALSWSVGRFEFRDDVRSDPTFEVAVPLKATVDLGKRQIHRWHTIRAKIPSGEIRFWKNQSTDEGKDPSDNERYSDLLDCVDRGLTVNQMVLEHHGRRFYVLSRLLEMIEDGSIAEDRRGEARAESDDGEEDIEALIQDKVLQGRRGEAYMIAARALERDSANHLLQTLHKELGRSLMAELSREFLTSFRVPKVVLSEPEIEALPLNDHEKYLVGRIDGHWDLLTLMRMSPMQEIEVLLTCKRLKSRGIIVL